MFSGRSRKESNKPANAESGGNRDVNFIALRSIEFAQ
jgi:hypothetical protein